MIDSEAPIIPIYHYVNAYLYRDGVKGVTPNPRLLVDFKQIGWNGGKRQDARYSG